MTNSMLKRMTMMKEQRNSQRNKTTLKMRTHWRNQCLQVSLVPVSKPITTKCLHRLIISNLSSLCNRISLRVWWCPGNSKFSFRGSHLRLPTILDPVLARHNLMPRISKGKSSSLLSITMLWKIHNRHRITAIKESQDRSQLNSYNNRGSLNITTNTKEKILTAVLLFNNSNYKCLRCSSSHSHSLCHRNSRSHKYKCHSSIRQFNNNNNKTCTQTTMWAQTSSKQKLKKIVAKWSCR